MRKSRKNCSKTKGEKTAKTLTDIDGEPEGGNKGFYACYLLTSLSPRHKGQTYIGFTVNPKRRIRQHNGEITMGATRTKKKRPWEMVLCIYGFPTQVAALQFEWAWQHPTESLAVRKAACGLKSLNKLPNKIILAFTMLTLHTWQSMDLTVNFFSTMYMTHVAACPTLPRQMKVQFGSMDDLPCYSSGNQSLHNDDNDWDLDPQECGGSDNIEDDRHSIDAAASSPENQADKESQQNQDYGAVEPRDSFTLIEEDDCQVDHLDQEFNTPVRDCAEKSAMTRTTYIEIEDSEIRYPPNRDTTFLMKDHDFPEQFQEFNTTLTEEVDSGHDLVHSVEEVTDETQASNVRQIEVIDLFTPSPNWEDNTHSKKRKVVASSTEGSRNNLDLSNCKQFLPVVVHFPQLFANAPDLAQQIISIKSCYC